MSEHYLVKEKGLSTVAGETFPMRDGNRGKRTGLKKKNWGRFEVVITTLGAQCGLPNLAIWPVGGGGDQVKRGCRILRNRSESRQGGLGKVHIGAGKTD